MIRNDLSILVADDMPLSCETIRLTLIKNGYHNIRITNTANEALTLLAAHPADIVLADWIMPGMDGLELTDRIRQQDEENNHYTSVILFTAKEGIENLEIAFERGVDDYLTKPVNERELIARIHAAGRIAALQNSLLGMTQDLTASNQQLQEMATTDPLTGLNNRRHMQTHLQALLAETVARGGAICLSIVDIDHFKNINDTHGHTVGDEVLVAFAKRLNRAVRPTDTVVRMGGEEFAIIMYYADAARINPDIFERIRCALSQRPIKTSAGDLAVTASFGVCVSTGTNATQSPESLIECADRKLYQAKSEGRNRIVY